MKLTDYGAADLPPVLLLSGARHTPEELRTALPGLETKYRVYLADGVGVSGGELADALRCAGVDRLWGAYGLEEGGTALLDLLSRRALEVRTAVTEGPFLLPEATLEDYAGTLICWKGGKDRKTQKAWKTLKAQLPPLRSLTLDKLKTGVGYMDRRPDLMEKRLCATFGEAVRVSATDVLVCPVGWLLKNAAKLDMPEMCVGEEGALRWERTDSGSLLREGAGSGFELWSHSLTVREAGDACVCTDEVVFSAGKKSREKEKDVLRWLRSVQQLRKVYLKLD